MHICTHLHTHTWTRSHMNAYTHMHMCTLIFMCTHTTIDTYHRALNQLEKAMLYTLLVVAEILLEFAQL